MEEKGSGDALGHVGDDGLAGHDEMVRLKILGVAVDDVFIPWMKAMSRRGGHMRRRYAKPANLPLVYQYALCPANGRNIHVA